MKNSSILLITSLFLLSFSACKIYTPEFKRYDNMRYETLGSNGFTLGTDIVFYNPNSFKFKINGVGLDVLINGKKMIYINEQRNVIVGRKSDFSIPLALTIKPDMNILEGIKELYKVYTNKELDLKVAGNIEVKWFLFKKSLPVEVNKKVKLK
jgi:LEA14-like dessication related protein